MLLLSFDFYFFNMCFNYRVKKYFCFGNNLCVLIIITHTRIQSNEVYKIFIQTYN